MHPSFQAAMVKSGRDIVDDVRKKGVFEVTQLLYGLYSSAIKENLYSSFELIHGVLRTQWIISSRRLVEEKQRRSGPG
jgi:hypothetical protein